MSLSVLNVVLEGKVYLFMTTKPERLVQCIKQKKNKLVSDDLQLLDTTKLDNHTFKSEGTNILHILKKDDFDVTADHSAKILTHFNDNGLLFRGSDGQMPALNMLDMSAIAWGALNPDTWAPDPTLSALYPFNNLIQNQGPPYSTSAFSKTSPVLWYVPNFVEAIDVSTPPQNSRTIGGLLFRNGASNEFRVKGGFLFDGDTNQRTLGQIPGNDPLDRSTALNIFSQLQPYLDKGTFKAVDVSNITTPPSNNTNMLFNPYFMNSKKLGDDSTNGFLKTVLGYKSKLMKAYDADTSSATGIALSGESWFDNNYSSGIESEFLTEPVTSNLDSSTDPLLKFDPKAFYGVVLITDASSYSDWETKIKTIIEGNTDIDPVKPTKSDLSNGLPYVYKKLRDNQISAAQDVWLQDTNTDKLPLYLITGVRLPILDITSGLMPMTQYNSYSDMSASVTKLPESAATRYVCNRPGTAPGQCSVVLTGGVTLKDCMEICT